MTFRVLPEADADAIEAMLWYDGQRAGLGSDFAREIDAAYSSIRSDPFGHSAHEDYEGEGDVRRLRVRRFPFVVVFHCLPTEVLVVAVAHTSRRPLYWLDRI